MKNKKGMTLIEVIVAIFLIGLIASASLPSIMSSFSIMNRGKGMTVDTFKTQQKIELSIEKIRDEIDKKLEDPTKTDPRGIPITAFSKTIKVSSIKEPIIGGTGHIYALVASGHVFEENLPEVSKVKLDQSAPSKITAPKYVLGANSNIKLEGNHNIVSLTNYFTDLRKWYVSNVGFDGFIPETVSNESDWGTRYPSWPNDYTLIKDIEANVLSMSSDYIGRHIVYSIIPVSKTGRYGLEIGSNPVYVNGPHTIGDLSLHLDASILENEDGTSFTSTSPRNWNDLSAKKNNATTTSNNVKTNYENGRFAQLRNNQFTISNNTTTKDVMTMFIVFSNTSTTLNKEQVIIKKDNNTSGWTFKIKDEKLQFIINPTSVYQPDRMVESKKSIDNSKYIVTLQVSSNYIDMIIDKDNYSEMPNRLNRGANSGYLSSTSTILGNPSSELNISEIIIFEKALTASYDYDDKTSDINKVRDYLAKKHRIELATELTP